MASLAAGRQRHAVLLGIVWVCFTVLVLCVVHRHEPFSDEAQSWLLARDCSFFEMLFRRMHYEGSPALWHGILWALVRIGAPFRSLSYLSALLASLSALLVLYFAPFPAWLRGLFVFGYYPAYQYAVVARSYCLNVLLVALAAIFYPTRESKPQRYCLILAALANANAFGFVVAVVLFLEFALTAWKSRATPAKQYLIAGIIFAVAALLAVAQASPAADVSFPPYHRITLAGVVTTLVVQIVRAFVEFPATTPARMMIALLLSAGVVAIGFSLAARAKKLLLAISVCAAPLAFEAFKHFSAYHAGLIYLSWVFGLWISWPAVATLSVRFRRSVIIATAFIFAIHAYDTLAAWRTDLTAPYSAGPQAAEFLKSHFGQGPALKLACVGVGTFAVQPYFTHNICANYFEGAPKPAYYIWKLGMACPYIADEPYLDRLMRSGQYDALLVSDQTLPQTKSQAVAQAAGYCVVRSFDGRVIWKDSFAYPDDMILFEKCGAGILARNK